MAKAIEMVGMVCGRFTVIKRAEKNKGNDCAWVCACECGNICEVSGSALRTGKIKSCGCYRRDMKTTHGKRKSRIYDIWAGMIDRCENKNNKFYYRYGGRGIKISEGFREFGTFYAVVGDPPAGLSLDRIDNDGNYEEGNVRWATQKEQCRNTSRNKIIEHNGESKSMVEWGDNMGESGSLIFARIKRGWSESDAVSLPKRGTIEYKGEKMNIRKWAEKTGISEKTISTRIQRGWTTEDALTKPNQRPRK
jgi:hypothetical protein